MLLFKRIILGSLALGFIFFGGSGTQSNSLLGQAAGIIGLIVGLIVLYIFLKMAWRAMGCLPSFLIFSIVVIFIMYAIGAFNDGITNVGGNLKSFLGQASEQSNAHQTSATINLVNREPDFAQEVAPVESFAPAHNPEIDNIFEEEVVSAFGDEFNDSPYQQQAPQQQAQQRPAQQQRPTNGSSAIENKVNEIINIFAGESQQVEQVSEPTIEEMPEIYSAVRVVNGDTLIIQGKYIKLYGIDAPEANQTCANRQGRSYACGKDAALWLRGWLSNYEVACSVMREDAKGNMVGACRLGDYDIGAAIVNAGWAVVAPTGREIYGPYEEDAKKNRRGLWQGRFYYPSDWRKMQSKEANIKVIKPKTVKKNILER